MAIIEDDVELYGKDEIKNIKEDVKERLETFLKPNRFPNIKDDDPKSAGKKLESHLKKFLDTLDDEFYKNHFEAVKNTNLIIAIIKNQYVDKFEKKLGERSKRSKKVKSAEASSQKLEKDLLRVVNKTVKDNVNKRIEYIKEAKPYLKLKDKFRKFAKKQTECASLNDVKELLDNFLKEYTSEDQDYYLLQGFVNDNHDRMGLIKSLGGPASVTQRIKVEKKRTTKETLRKALLNDCKKTSKEVTLEVGKPLDLNL